MTKIPMTAFGFEQLKKELNHLKSVERPKNIADISEARAHGDLKENAEYHAAKERQSFVEGRILEIEGKLSQAQIIDISKIPNEGKAIFGATIVLINLDTDTSHRYQIVGDDEADIKQGKLSCNAPIAKAVIGKFVGDTIQLTEILMFGGDKTVTGDAAAKGKVTAEILGQDKGEKVLVFKKKRRHNYRRKNGHRQLLTVVRITEITNPDGKTVKAEARAVKAPRTEAEITASAQKAHNARIAKSGARVPAAKKAKATAKPAAKKAAVKTETKAAKKPAAKKAETAEKKPAAKKPAAKKKES